MCRQASVCRSRLIGAGGQGSSDTRTALRVPGVELTAVSDIYDGRLTRAKEGLGIAALHFARLS
jgi:predicted homoserine dehydrogenase-like protein